MPIWLGRELIVVRSSASFQSGAEGGPIRISGSQARSLPGWIRSFTWRFGLPVLLNCVCGYLGEPFDIWCISLLLWDVWILGWPHYQQRGTVLANEASSKLKHLLTEDLGIKYQLVPPDIHRRNAAERAIRTFKAHSLSILAVIAPDFLNFLRDHLLPHTEMTLNFLRQSTLKPTKPALECFNAPFEYAATPIGPLGCQIIVHKNLACCAR